MNKTKNLFNHFAWGFLIFPIILMSSCEGPVGPPGPPGPDGLDGEVILGEVFEVVGTFSADTEFGIAGEYGFEIFESDMVLIYHLDAVFDGDIDLWRPLPRTEFVDEVGIFNYSFDFTFFEYSIFMRGNFDLRQLGPEWTDDQVFRVFILPGEFIDSRMDLSDQAAILEMMDMDEQEIKRIQLN